MERFRIERRFVASKHSGAGAGANFSREKKALADLKAWAGSAAARSCNASVFDLPNDDLCIAIVHLSTASNKAASRQAVVPVLARVLSALARVCSRCQERLAKLAQPQQPADADGDVVMEEAYGQPEEAVALQELLKQSTYWCCHLVQAVERCIQASGGTAAQQQASGWEQACSSCMNGLADLYTAMLEQPEMVFPALLDKLAADELVMDTVLQLVSTDVPAGSKTSQLSQAVSGHMLLARQLLPLKAPKASASELYSNITTLMMQEKADRLSAVLAEAMLVALQHEQQFIIYYIVQLSNLCSSDLGASKQQQGAAAAVQQDHGQNDSRGYAMLQVLLLVAAEDPALAGVLLQALQSCISSSKAQVRKQLLGLASSSVAPAGSTCQKQAGLIAVLTACNDKDATVRARAVGILHGLVLPLWQYLLAGWQALQQAAQSPAGRVIKLLSDRLLDKSKTVRIKSLQLLAALMDASISCTTVLPPGSSSRQMAEELQQLLLCTCCPSICANLDAPKTSQLFCAEAAELATQFLIKSSPVLQQSGMLHKLLVGAGAAAVPAQAEQTATGVAAASDAVLQTLLVHSMPTSLKAAHDMWGDILAASSQQQVTRYKQLLHQAGAPSPQLRQYAMGSICSSLAQLQEAASSCEQAQTQAMQQLETSAKLLYVTGQCSNSINTKSCHAPAASGADVLGEIVIVLDVIEAMLEQQRHGSAAERVQQQEPDAAAVRAAPPISIGTCLAWLFRALAAMLEPWLQQSDKVGSGADSAKGQQGSGKHVAAACSIVMRFAQHRFKQLSCSAATVDTVLELLCALPNAQPVLLKLLSQCHQQLLSMGALDVGEDEATSNDAVWEGQAAVAAVQAFLQLAYHSCSIYQHEKEAFVQQLQAVRQQASRSAHTEATNAGEQSGIAAGMQADASTGAAGIDHGGKGSSSSKGFAYMQQEEQRKQDEAAAQEYLDQMMQSSAPACYLPLLADLVQATCLSEGLRVLALQALGRLMLLSDQVVQQYRSIIMAVASISPEPAAGGAVPAGAGGAPSGLRLQQQALQLASSLVLQNPNANLQMLQGLEALLLPPAGSVTTGCSSELAATAAALYSHVLLHDKLQYSQRMFEVVAGCLTHEHAVVREVAVQALHAMLKAQDRQRHKVVLSLLAICQKRGLAGVVQQVLLPALGPKDLSADTLVLPVLQSLYVAVPSSEAAAVACKVLSCMTPSAKALSAMLSYLQAHPELLEGLPDNCLKDLAAFCTSAKVAAGQQGQATGAACLQQAGQQQAAVPGEAQTAGKLGGKETKARLLQLLQAALQCTHTAGARRKRKGRLAAIHEDEDAAAEASGLCSYQAALARYKEAVASAKRH